MNSHGDCSAEQLACGAILVEDYNMPLHIGAVFIILVTSGLGVMLPLISGWFRKPVSASTTNLNASDSDSDLARDTHAGFASSAAFGKGAGVWGNVFFVARHFGTVSWSAGCKR
jgi:zinc transporter 1/2/3